jgi:hypothetical protein
VDQVRADQVIAEKLAEEAWQRFGANIDPSSWTCRRRLRLRDRREVVSSTPIPAWCRRSLNELSSWTRAT